mmetsp:Transcript_27117/g.37425  ORF Transcript_27117/g.37425 Transcript_27117/m.37425 type:complete len:172 (+) Transcript_27117:1148-1663(+)
MAEMLHSTPSTHLHPNPPLPLMVGTDRPLVEAMEPLPMEEDTLEVQRQEGMAADMELLLKAMEHLRPMVEDMEPPVEEDTEPHHREVATLKEATAATSHLRIQHRGAMIMVTEHPVLVATVMDTLNQLLLSAVLGRPSKTGREEHIITTVRQVFHSGKSLKACKDCLPFAC